MIQYAISVILSIWKNMVLSYCRDKLIFRTRRVSEVAQTCPTLCDPMYCNLIGSSVHGIFQPRILGWVAISFPRGSSQLRDQTHISLIASGLFPLSHQGIPLEQGNWGQFSPLSTIWPSANSLISPNLSFLFRNKQFINFNHCIKLNHESVTDQGSWLSLVNRNW